MKIYSEELNNRNLDSIPAKELQNMIGWIEPPEDNNGTWDVTTSDGGGFECNTQENAMIISNLVEIKALLLRY